MSKLIESIPTEVTEAVTESLRLFQQARFRNQTDRPDASQPLPSLLERCEQYISEDCQPHKEPIRLIHHFACTGGTLITRCLACSPNVQALSEVDPLSPITQPSGKFNPTDLIQLLQHSNRIASNEDKLSVFQAAFGVLHDSAVRKGLRILVRDHTHSHFCTDDKFDQRPAIGHVLAEQYETRSIITVRHPLDSWLSIAKNRWIHFSPGTLDEYAQRYQKFLATYPNTSIFKYEDFVASTDEVLRDMCIKLELPFPTDFHVLFTAHSFSGDSGRKGEVIKPRDRRPVSEDLMAKAHNSSAFQSLCQQLKYEISG